MGTGPGGGVASTVAPSAQSSGNGSTPTLSPTPTSTPTPTTIPTPTPSSAKSTPTHPAQTPLLRPNSGALAIHVQGNHLMNSAGDVVTLHGADMSGSEFVCAQGWSNDPFGGQPEDNSSTFAAMKSWGINVVRIPLNEDCWLGINGVSIGGAAYQGPVIKLVRDLEADGFYVIVDLHWSAPGTQEAGNQNDYPDEDHSPAFWTSVAQNFKSDPGVLFDLYNEPIGYWIANGESEWQCLWQGCEVTESMTGSNAYTPGVDWQTAGFDQLTSDIRNAGASNVIMAGCMGWAENCSGWTDASGDSNTVMSWHAYPQSGDDPSADQTGYWNPTIAPIAAKYPVVIGETGDSTSPPTSFLSALLPWADSHGISYLAWTWNAWSNSSNVLVTSMTAGTPTAGEGVCFKAHLAALG